MRGSLRRLVPALVLLALVSRGGVTSAQTPHDHGSMPMPDSTSGWHLMQDGVVFAGWNHQGGPRGGDEFVAPNWWMGMASRDTSRGRLTFTGMLSLDRGHARPRRLPRDLPVGRDTRWRSSHRPSASARPLHAARRRLADADQQHLGFHDCGRTCRRARARPGRLHAPRLVRRQPGSAARRITCSTRATSRSAS